MSAGGIIVRIRTDHLVRAARLCQAVVSALTLMNLTAQLAFCELRSAAADADAVYVLIPGAARPPIARHSRCTLNVWVVS